jgi:hypothetical protein
MGSYWERVTTLVCDIVETCSVLVKIYLICFENTAVLFTCIFSIAITVVQCSNAESVICMRDVGKDSFVRSMEIRRDAVYSRILQEMFTMDNFISYASVVINSFSEHNRHNLTREPVYHHFDSMRTQSTCSHAHRMQLYVL